MNTYLETPSQINSTAPVIFKKAIVRHHVYRLALFDFYQDESRESIREEFSGPLMKIASPRLVDEVEGFYQRVVTKTRNWYTSESKNLSIEISKKKMDVCFEKLAMDLGIDLTEGARPFTPFGLDAGAKAKKAGK